MIMTGGKSFPVDFKAQSACKCIKAGRREKTARADPASWTLSPMMGIGIGDGMKETGEGLGSRNS